MLVLSNAHYFSHGFGLAISILIAIGGGLNGAGRSGDKTTKNHDSSFLILCD